MLSGVHGLVFRNLDYETIPTSREENAQALQAHRLGIVPSVATFRLLCDPAITVPRQVTHLLTMSILPEGLRCRELTTFPLHHGGCHPPASPALAYPNGIEEPGSPRRFRV